MVYDVTSQKSFLHARQLLHLLQAKTSSVPGVDGHHGVAGPGRDDLHLCPNDQQTYMQKNFEVMAYSSHNANSQRNHNTCIKGLDNIYPTVSHDSHSQDDQVLNNWSSDETLIFNNAHIWSSDSADTTISNSERTNNNYLKYNHAVSLSNYAKPPTSESKCKYCDVPHSKSSPLTPSEVTSQRHSQTCQLLHYVDGNAQNMSLYIQNHTNCCHPISGDINVKRHIKISLNHRGKPCSYCPSNSSCEPVSKVNYETDDDNHHQSNCNFNPSYTIKSNRRHIHRHQKHKTHSRSYVADEFNPSQSKHPYNCHGRCICHHDCIFSQSSPHHSPYAHQSETNHSQGSTCIPYHNHQQNACYQNQSGHLSYNPSCTLLNSTSLRSHISTCGSLKSQSHHIYQTDQNPNGSFPRDHNTHVYTPTVHQSLAANPHTGSYDYSALGNHTLNQYHTRDHSFGHNRLKSHDFKPDSLKDHNLEFTPLRDHSYQRNHSQDQSDPQGRSDLRGYTTLLLGNKRDLEHCR